jgi:hypothetical protein
MYQCIIPNVIFLMIFLLLQTCLAGTYTVTIAKYSQECFTEILKVNDRIEIGYQVFLGNGDDKLDCLVTSPQNANIHQVTQEQAAAFGFNSVQEGVHTICLNNKAAYEKSVTFTVNAPDEQSPLKAPHDYSGEEEQLAKDITYFSNQVRFLNDEQKYMNKLADRHLQTINSTSSRVFYFNLLQISLIIAVGCFQIFYLMKVVGSNPDF